MTSSKDQGGGVGGSKRARLAQTDAGTVGRHALAETA